MPRGLTMVPESADCRMDSAVMWVLDARAGLIGETRVFRSAEMMILPKALELIALNPLSLEIRTWITRDCVE